jgi:hypothetical protein
MGKIFLREKRTLESCRGDRTDEKHRETEM